MVLAGLVYYGRWYAFCHVEQLRLGHLLVALLAPGAVAVDVLPGLGVDEGQVLGADAHDGPVLLVHGGDIVGQRAAGQLQAVGVHRGAVQNGPGKASEGMEEEVIDDSGHDIERHLCISALC